MICNMENFEALLGGTNWSHWPLIPLLAHKESSFEASFEDSIPIQAAWLQQEMGITESQQEMGISRRWE